MIETTLPNHDSKLHAAKFIIDHLQAELVKLQTLDDLRRGQRDSVKQAALHAFSVWSDPCSSPEAVANAMFALRTSTQF